MKKNYFTLIFLISVFFAAQGQTGDKVYDLANNCYNVTFKKRGKDTEFVYSSVPSKFYFKPSGGLAHMGLLPDMIQDLKGQGYSDQDLDVLFNGAEEYLRLWERSINASQFVRDSNVRVAPLDEVVNRSEATLETTSDLESGMKPIVYPTLVQNTFNLEVNRPSILEVSVYDTQGRVYYKETLNYKGSYPQTIDNLESVPPGVFFVRVQDQGSAEYAVFKVIKK